jgi:predicted nucleic acid-binding protein
MILYLDTSALVKRYFKESYSDEIITRWKSAPQIVTSFVAYAETMASIYRKKREAELSDALISEVVRSFRRDWESFVRVEVNEELNGYIDRVVGGYPLRGFDAIHLASALAIKEMLPENFVFACFDDRLTRAARSEGLQTFPEKPAT